MVAEQSYILSGILGQRKLGKKPQGARHGRTIVRGAHEDHPLWCSWINQVVVLPACVTRQQEGFLQEDPAETVAYKEYRPVGMLEMAESGSKVLAGVGDQQTYGAVPHVLHLQQ